MKQGFDNNKYLRMQSQNILDRIAQFGGKLYLEFGGKLFDDHHASRVLPGFEPDSKIKMLLELKDDVEMIIVVSANDIEKNKVRGDLGITYDLDTLRLIDSFRDQGLYVSGVVITQFCGQLSAEQFEKRLFSYGINVYRHYLIQGYPTNIPLIVSEDGFGKNDYIHTTRKLVVITAPGPGSGKMAVCLSQLYHDSKRGIKAGYAKFETFPVWNLPLKHPVNIAYESATADLNDVNMIDPFHLETYGEKAVNYNRDVEVFPVLKAMFQKIYGTSPYNSPTDMGVNMAGYCIFDNEAVCNASKQEVIRRYFHAACAAKRGCAERSEVYKIEMLMSDIGITVEDRPCVCPAREKAIQTGEPAVSIELPNGKIVTGKTSALLGSSCSALLNAIKEIAGIPDDVHLISPTIIEPMQHLKVNHMGNQNPRLHTDEVLIALSICAASNPLASKALRALSELKGSEAHSTVILSHVDSNTFRNLGVNITCEPDYQNDNQLYHR